MPIGVTSVEQIFSPGDNGVRIVSQKGTFEVFQSQIPSNVINKPIATIEAWINNFLAQTQPDFFAVVHIFTVSPFSFTIYAGETAPSGSWWLPA